MRLFPIEKIIASFDNKLPEEEKQELESWLGKSTKNRQYYDETKKVYDTSKKIRSNFHPNENAALKKVNRHLTTKKILRWSYRVAAAMLLVFIASKVVLLLGETQWNEITIENKHTIFLPDSSKVILAKNSTFKYPEEFENIPSPLARRRRNPTQCCYS